VRPSRRSTLSRVFGAVRHAIFDESRQGRAAEIAGWSNAASAFVLALGLGVLTWSRIGVHAVWVGLVAGGITLALLRLALTHRTTVWIASALGTLTLAAMGGSTAWLFAHVLEIPSAPSIAAVLGAVLAALAPAWSYAQLARRRAEHMRDSLIDPISVPHSR
jgi:hypothetical protein